MGQKWAWLPGANLGQYCMLVEGGFIGYPLHMEISVVFFNLKINYFK